MPNVTGLNAVEEELYARVYASEYETYSGRLRACYVPSGTGGAMYGAGDGPKQASRLARAAAFDAVQVLRDNKSGPMHREPSDTPGRKVEPPNNVCRDCGGALIFRDISSMARLCSNCGLDHTEPPE